MNISAEETSSGLELNENIVGRQDILYQSGTAESLAIISEDNYDFDVYKYLVQKNDTLSSIAKLYNKNITTIMWANNLSNKDQILKVGQVLRIPAIDGAYYKVAKGDTLESISKKTNSNPIDIWDLNSGIIDYNNPVLAEGTELFIPNGVIPTPPPVVAVRRKTTSSNPAPVTVNVQPGVWVHPLKYCSGWTWSRGFSSSHGGADMAKRGGCWINAAASGKVVKAGWGGFGNTTIIDHGGGIRSIYGHGSGAFKVKAGDYVQGGQLIMYMGNTGYSFGTHLHFQIEVNGRKVNPESFVKLH